MGKKKFIDKKNSATFRLVFKESSADDVAGDPDRVFTRVDGGDNFVPGFSLDDQGSIFDDAEEDEEEEEEEEKQEHETGGGGQRLKHPGSHLNPLPGHLRRELVELGFPDDGYNYLTHLREMGASGRSGSFVPNNNLRLDRLHADIKVYDASRVQVSRTEEDSDNDALLVSQSTSQIRGPATKVLDPQVVALLEVDDGSVYDSADELEDDFITRANEGRESSATVRSQSQQYMDTNSDVSSGSPEDKEALGQAYSDDERPARLLDEQFELLALREYEVEDVGELDDEDPSAHGPAHISQFSNIMSDFLMDNSIVQEKYQTPAEVLHKNECWRSERQLNVHDDVRDSKCIPKLCGTKDDTLLLLNTPSSSLMADSTDPQSDTSEDDKVLVIESDSNENEGQWDCESIVTTYSNFENHPCEIHSPLKQSGKYNLLAAIKPTEANNSVIRLKGKQQLPVDFLPQKGRLSRVDDKGTVNSGNVADLKEKKPSTARRRAGESKEERKARKEAFKEEKRDARRVKKELKLLYEGESKRAQHGAAFSGPATIPL